MQANLVTIIVPVYNCEQYLRDCIDSVLRQTYRNIELLLIDDGSTDRSGSICDEYCSIDNRVKTIHQKNSGVSTARNHGIDEALGKYLMFVDSDDMLTDEAVSLLVEDLEGSNSDIVVGSYYCLYDNNIIYRRYNLFKGKNLFKDLSNKLIDDGTLSGITLGSVCGVLFIKESIQKYSIKFHENIKVNEDGLFNLELITHLNSIWYEEKPIYFYRQINRQKTKKHRDLKHNFKLCDTIIRSNPWLMNIGNIDIQLARRELTIIWFLSLNAVWNNENYPKEELLELWESVNFEQSKLLLDNNRLGKPKRLIWSLICKKRTCLFFVCIRYIYPVLIKVLKR